LLGTHFESYELCISVILKFFSGRGELWVTETADTGGTPVYIYVRVVII
jgi:hypothetical protein